MPMWHFLHCLGAKRNQEDNCLIRDNHTGTGLRREDKSPHRWLYSAEGGVLKTIVLSSAKVMKATDT